MCHSEIILSAVLLLTRINAESTEDHQAFTNFYPPSTVDFHDIYSNSLGLLTDETSNTPAVKEEFHISNMPSQLVEFRAPSTSAPPTSTTIDATTGNESAENMTDVSSTPSTSTADDSEDSAVKVLPIKKNYERGVLDLLFPATRVRTFKSIFDTFRRIMSHTFRR